MKNLWITLVAVAAFTAACDKGTQGGGPGGAGSGGAPTGPVTLNGSGSTFQKQFQEVAIEGFTKANPNIKVNYGGGGSGKGRQDFADQVSDYACTDGLYNDADKAKVKGGDFLYFPILFGAISVSYNLDGVDKLQLSADTIAKIFQRDVKNWNDDAIAADNPGVTLPDLDITVAHRADGSGTTEQFTKYLASASPDTWKLKSGSTVEWTPDTQAGQGNGGVAQIIKSTKGAIGYVDLPDAKAAGLHYAMVKNQAGKFIEPTAESAQAAGDGVEVKPDLTYVSVNAKGDASYPITAPTWCMAYVKYADKNKAAAVKAYFKYMLGDAQGMTKEIDFAPLPKSIQDKAIAQLDKIQTQ